MRENRRTFLKQLGLGSVGFGLAQAFPPAFAAETGHTALPRATPEAHGVASKSILDFLEGWATAQEALQSQPHSFMLLRHGHVLAEGWWTPYRAGAPHILHSLSKSFTSTAVGFLVAEGKVQAEDPVTRFFPEALPAQVSDNLAALRVKHLLSMSVGHPMEAERTIMGRQDWVREFLSTSFESTPGSVFRYYNVATYMLSALVQKVSGEKLIDYMRPRLFNPLGIGPVSWDVSPQGIHMGAWGLRTTTETIAKLGQLYLQEGRWNGKQLLPRSWVHEATTFKIQQPAGSTPDWEQGYCYQFWRCRHNAFRGDGAFGQFCVVMPDQDAVLAITSETANMQGILDLAWKHLLPAFGPAALPNDNAVGKALKNHLASLALPAPQGAFTSPLAASISGKTMAIEPNSLGVQRVSFTVSSDSCRFMLEHDGGRSEVQCGLGRWTSGLTTMPGIPPALSVVSEPKGPIKVAATGAWQDASTLELLCHYYELGHYDRITCRFAEGGVNITFMRSVALWAPEAERVKRETRPVLRGRIA